MEQLVPWCKCQTAWVGLVVEFRSVRDGESITQLRLRWAHRDQLCVGMAGELVRRAMSCKMGRSSSFLMLFRRSKKNTVFDLDNPNQPLVLLDLSGKCDSSLKHLFKTNRPANTV